MTFSLTWLLPVLEGAGLKVAPVDGWENRGHGDAGPTLGVICHHTVGPRQGNMPSLGTLLEGNTNARGPLAQLGLGRDGTYYLVAAGRCFHAGEGSFKGITTGNKSFVGIEAENAGGQDDAWPEVQMDAYARGVAAILRHAQRPVEFCIAHKEWAPTRKPFDPRFDMNQFRVRVAGFLTGATPAPPLIPAVEPPGAGNGRPTLHRGASGNLVSEIQRKLGVPIDGSFGPRTEAAVRRFQRERQLVPDGIVGPRTWPALDTLP